MTTEPDFDSVMDAAGLSVHDFESKMRTSGTEVYLPDWFWSRYGEEKILERARLGMFTAKRYPSSTAVDEPVDVRGSGMADEVYLTGEGPQNDPAVALYAAARLFAPCFCDVAGCTDAGAVAAAQRVTAVAEVFVRWLRRPASLSIRLVAIEDVDTGEPVADPPHRGEDMALELKIGQRARYTIEARDARGFLNKEALDLTVTNGDDVTAEIVETPDPETPNELVVTAVEPGVGTVVTLDVPDDETVAPASDSYNVRAGDIATLALGTPVIEDVPAEPTP